MSHFACGIVTADYKLAVDNDTAAYTRTECDCNKAVLALACACESFAEGCTVGVVINIDFIGCLFIMKGLYSVSQIYPQFDDSLGYFRKFAIISVFKTVSLPDHPAEGVMRAYRAMAQGADKGALWLYRK